MNIINCFLDSTIRELISIFKEIYMDVNIVHVDTIDDKWGLRKVMTDDKGNKYKVTAKQKFYDHVHGAGVYALRMGEFKGKQFVQWAELKEPAGGSATTAAEKPQEGGVLSDKLAFEKARQNDIMTQFYARLAFDILNSDKNSNEKITSSKVMLEAGKLMRLHKSTVTSYELDENNIQSETFDKVAEAPVETVSTTPLNPEEVPW